MQSEFCFWSYSQHPTILIYHAYAVVLQIKSIQLVNPISLLTQSNSPFSDMLSVVNGETIYMINFHTVNLFF